MPSSRAQRPSISADVRRALSGLGRAWSLWTCRSPSRSPSTASRSRTGVLHDAIIASMTSPPEAHGRVRRRSFGAPPRETRRRLRRTLPAIRDRHDAADSGHSRFARQPCAGSAGISSSPSSPAAIEADKLWDDTGAAGEVPPAAAAELADSLRQVYARVDAAIGRLVEAAGDDVRAPTSRSTAWARTPRGWTCCRKCSRRADHPRPRPPRRGRPGLLSGCASWFPTVAPLGKSSGCRWRSRIGDHVLAGGPACGRAFCLVADVQGYVRLNLRGRGAEGIVALGDEYDRLGESRRGCPTFVDGADGMPVVHEVVRRTGCTRPACGATCCPISSCSGPAPHECLERSVRLLRHGATARCLVGPTGGAATTARTGSVRRWVGRGAHHGPRTDGVCASAGAAGCLTQGRVLVWGVPERGELGTSHPERGEGAMTQFMAPSLRSG